MKHLTPQQMSKFLNDGMLGRDAIRVAKHLDHCAVCQSRVQQLDPIHSLLLAVAEPEAPTDFIEQMVVASAQIQPSIAQRIPILESIISLGILAPVVAILISRFDIKTLLHQWLSMVSEAGLATTKIMAIDYTQIAIVTAGLLIPLLLATIIKVSAQNHRPLS